MGTTATRFRTLTLLSSSLRQRHWRRLFWTASAIYLVAVIAFSVFGILIGRDDTRGLFQSLQIVHFGMALELPAYLACRLVDDAASGTLQFMQVAGFPSAAWIRFRLLFIATGYAGVWVLRLPFYAFLLNGGGASATELLWAELLCTALAIAVAQASLLAARKVELPTEAMLGAIAILFLNFALMILAGAMFLAGWILPIPFNWFGEALRSLSMFNYFMNPPVTIEGRLAALCAASFHIAIGIAASVWLRRDLYAEAEPGVRSEKNRDRTRSESKGQQRPSRRVWSNPFHWQASEYYFTDAKSRRSWVLLFGGVFPVTIAMVIRSDAASIFLGMWTIFACVAPEMLPAKCAELELKEKTLSSLAILPCCGQGVYRGWKRFGDKYRLAVWLASCGAVAVLAWRHPVLALLWASVAIVSAWSYPPLAFVDALRAPERSRLRMISRVAIGAIVGPLAVIVATQSQQGILILLGTAALAACIFRARAMRQMDELFVHASSL